MYAGDTLVGHLATSKVTTETEAGKWGKITVELLADRIAGGWSFVPPWVPS